MARSALQVIVCGCLCLLVSCGEDNSVNSPAPEFDGASLLGLVNNRTLTYLQTDTIVTIDSAYVVTVKTSAEVVRVVGSGEDWVIRDGDVPVLNFKLTGDAVIHNGYWRSVDGHDSLFYISEPPVVLRRSFRSADTWVGFTPWFDTDTSRVNLLFYNVYFGFHFEKEFAQTSRILVPAGSFKSYRFDVRLFTDVADTIPAVEVSEYYAPSVGLVKLRLQGGSLKRTLSLVDVH